MTVLSVSENSRFYPSYIEKIRPQNCWESFVFKAVDPSSKNKIIHLIAISILAALVLILTMGALGSLVARMYQKMSEYEDRMRLVIETINLFKGIETDSNAIPSDSISKYTLIKAGLEIQTLQEWAQKAPPGELREKAVRRIMTCWQTKASTLRIEDLNLSSLPPSCETLMSKLVEIDKGAGRIRSTYSCSLLTKLMHTRIVSMFCRITNLLSRWGIHQKVDHFQYEIDTNGSLAELLNHLERLSTWEKEKPTYYGERREEAVKRVLYCWQTEGETLDFSDLNLSSLPPFIEDTFRKSLLNYTVDLGYAKICWPQSAWSRYQEQASDQDIILKILELLRQLDVRGVSEPLQSTLQGAYDSYFLSTFNIARYTKHLEEFLLTLVSWRDASPDECRQEAVKRILTAWQKNASHLDLSRLKLTSLPDITTLLPSLVSLDLHDNQLSEFPSRNLPCLAKLDISSNQFKKVPFIITSKLTVLSVKDNPIEDTSTAMRHYPTLTTLILNTTTFEEPLDPAWLLRS